MNIEQHQFEVKLTVTKKNQSFAKTLKEIAHFSRKYENDHVEVKEIVKSGNVKKKENYLILLAISRDLDNLGEELLY
ncbi:hypothetical protein QUF99_25600 [Bacillus sp. DX4.1]|uniref:hypothetical protein n=1 Tax=Bacillus sp. DX4.1 TaxID=3055867 RepID=UPI0025A22B22|nr:hypothetical protein [Bacillus sp. DX4.1]MDM5190577.1 hypothetical protein [Bacillus sp. DX4.1]